MPAPTRLIANFFMIFVLHVRTNSTPPSYWAWLHMGAEWAVRMSPDIRTSPQTEKGKHWDQHCHAALL